MMKRINIVDRFGDAYKSGRSHSRNSSIILLIPTQRNLKSLNRIRAFKVCSLFSAWPLAENHLIEWQLTNYTTFTKAAQIRDLVRSTVYDYNLVKIEIMLIPQWRLKYLV